MSWTPTNRTVRAESYCRQAEEIPRRSAAPTRRLVVGAVLPVDAGALLPHRLDKVRDVDSSSLAVPFDHLISVARAKAPRLMFDAIHKLRAA